MLLVAHIHSILVIHLHSPATNIHRSRAMDTRHLQMMDPAKDYQLLCHQMEDNRHHKDIISIHLQKIMDNHHKSLLVKNNRPMARLHLQDILIRLQGIRIPHLAMARHLHLDIRLLQAMARHLRLAMARVLQLVDIPKHSRTSTFKMSQILHM